MPRPLGIAMNVPTLAGGGGAAGLSFTDSFDRADGAIGNDWTGATWTVASNAVLNTPTPGDELVTNGTFATDIVGWTDISSGTATISFDAVNGNPAGALALNGVDSGNRGWATQAITTEAGRWYVISRENNSTLNLYLGTSSGGTQIWSTSNGGGAHIDTFRSTQATIYISPQATTTRWVDNVSVKPLSGLFVYRTLAAGPGEAQVKVLCATTSYFLYGGLGIYVDDDNYVIALTEIRGARIKLLKRVAGTTTVVANVAGAFSTGAPLQLTRAAGGLYSVSYNDAVVIASQAIADAVFDDADKWCLFSTNSQITFNDYTYQQL